MSKFTEGGLRYQEFIDGFVKLARSDTGANRIRQNGHAERVNDDDLPLTPEEAERKALLLSLKDHDRELIAQMLEDCRRSAIHDVLADLQWSYSCGGLELTSAGHRFPIDPFWGEMHADFVCRLEGDEWLAETLQGDGQ